MANNQPPQGPPFNFDAAAEAHRALANQNQACAESQAALTADGALLLQEIRNLRVEMNARFNQIEQRARAEYASSIRFILGILANHISRININAKLENRFLRQNDKLAPLRSYTDNTEIPDFPVTPGDITRLACMCCYLSLM